MHVNASENVSLGKIPSGIYHLIAGVLITVGIFVKHISDVTSKIPVSKILSNLLIGYDLKPKGTEHLTPRKALFGLNIPLSLEIRKVILRFAGIFILKNHLSSVREKFQMEIFVPGKEHFPQSYLAYYKGM